MFSEEHDTVLRFMADAMLGRLARWLRIVGYDTAYEKVISDQAFIDQALKENRWVLTRDGYLAERKVLRGRHTLMTSDYVQEQLGQLHRELKIDLDMSRPKDHRCADCNVTLTSLSYSDAAPLVPRYVAQHFREFLQCRKCRRVFWPGTHWEGLLARLSTITADDR
jgi:uncharacterized protein with PIN domain